MAADDDGLKSGKIRYKSWFLWMNTDVWGSLDGADNRSRTYDLRITNALLYQLSYIGPARGVHEGESRGKRLELSGRCVNSQWNQLPIFASPVLIYARMVSSPKPIHL